MREGFVKLVVGLTAVASLALGGVFLLFPATFVELSEAESINVGWLRNVGAALVSVQGFGLLIATFRRRDTNPILLLTAIASSLQSVAGWYSLFTGEFSAQAQWSIVVPSLLATIAAILLWFAWISRRRTAAGLPASGRAAKGGQNPADAGAGAPEFADAPLEE